MHRGWRPINGPQAKQSRVPSSKDQVYPGTDSQTAGKKMEGDWKCDCGGCTWIGDRSGLQEHVSTAHDFDTGSDRSYEPRHETGKPELSQSHSLTSGSLIISGTSDSGGRSTKPPPASRDKENNPQHSKQAPDPLSGLPDVVAGGAGTGQMSELSSAYHASRGPWHNQASRAGTAPQKYGGPQEVRGPPHRQPAYPASATHPPPESASLPYPTPYEIERRHWAERDIYEALVRTNSWDSRPEIKMLLGDLGTLPGHVSYLIDCGYGALLERAENYYDAMMARPVVARSAPEIPPVIVATAPPLLGRHSSHIVDSNANKSNENDNRVLAEPSGNVSYNVGDAREEISLTKAGKRRRSSPGVLSPSRPSHNSIGKENKRPRDDSPVDVHSAIRDGRRAVSNFTQAALGTSPRQRQRTATLLSVSHFSQPRPRANRTALPSSRPPVTAQQSASGNKGSSRTALLSSRTPSQLRTVARATSLSSRLSISVEQPNSDNTGSDRTTLPSSGPPPSVQEQTSDDKSIDTNASTPSLGARTALPSSRPAESAQPSSRPPATAQQSNCDGNNGNHTALPSLLALSHLRPLDTADMIARTERFMRSYPVQQQTSGHAGSDRISTVLFPGPPFLGQQRASNAEQSGHAVLPSAGPPALTNQTNHLHIYGNTSNAKDDGGKSAGNSANQQNDIAAAAAAVAADNHPATQSSAGVHHSVPDRGPPVIQIPARNQAPDTAHNNPAAPINNGTLPAIQGPAAQRPAAVHDSPPTPYYAVAEDPDKDKGKKVIEHAVRDMVQDKTHVVQIPNKQRQNRGEDCFVCREVRGHKSTETFVKYHRTVERGWMCHKCGAWFSHEGGYVRHRKHARRCPWAPGEKEAYEEAKKGQAEDE